MEIDYNSKRVLTQHCEFEGETDDGRGFTIYANWDSEDDWAVDDVSAHDGELTQEEYDQITQEFLEYMN